MNNDNDFFKNFSESGNNSMSKFKTSFLLPFLSGAFGTLLVIGIVFGVPSIRETVLDVEQSTEIASNADIQSNNTSVFEDNKIATQVSLDSFTNTSIYAANKVLPSIVGIKVDFTVSAYGRTQTSSAQGSGIIINEEGYILTNNHIISSSDSSYYYEVSEANSVTVSLYNSDTTYQAKIIGTDAQTDLAIIKIEADNLVPATLGNSDSVKVGEFVLAVGNPLGLESSVTFGIVSALNRDITSEDGTAYNVIQTDCAINSGNSGGALVNSDGEVIGINTLKLSGTGIEGVGFAIPINNTIDIYEELISYGKVKRPYIGISGTDLDSSLASYYNLPEGIYVQSVESGSPAELAGLKQGDVIVSINNTKVLTMDELNEVKNSKNIGDTISIEFYRNNKKNTVNVKLAETP